MTHEMQSCPNCGAYVLSGDDYCPRCDHRLADAAPEAVAEVDRGEPITAEGEVEAPAAGEVEAAETVEEAGTADQTASRAQHTSPDARIPEPDEIDTAEIDVEAILAETSNAIDGDDSPPARPDESAPVTSDPMDMTHPAIKWQSSISVPPAPYTPPPLYVPAPAPAVPPAIAFVQQRVDAYRRSGYQLRSHRPYEAVLSCGKGLSVGGWFLALVSIIGALWYLLLLALSGFQRDTVHIVLESDGYVYEDGPGAAHIRRQRSRVGRRWAAFGLLILVVCLVLAIALGGVAAVTLTQQRYQAAVREAYPAVTLFEERFSAAEAAPDDVELAKDGVVAFSILAGIALVGLWGGATLFVIGSIHAGAYQVKVPALPGWD